MRGFYGLGIVTLGSQIISLNKGGFGGGGGI